MACDLALYTVTFLATCQENNRSMEMEWGARTIIAVSTMQAVNSIEPSLREDYPEDQGWRLCLSANRVPGQIIKELIREWGWAPTK